MTIQEAECFRYCKTGGSLGEEISTVPTQIAFLPKASIQSESPFVDLGITARAIETFLSRSVPRITLEILQIALQAYYP